MIKRCYDCVYATDYAYRSERYRENVRGNARKLSVAVNALADHLDIDERVLVLYKPLPQNNWSDVYTYGFLEARGNIILDPRFSFSRLIQTLSHEFWHVRQYYNGELSFFRDESGKLAGLMWKNQAFPRNYPVTSDTMSVYNEEPWEIEARANEARLSEIAHAAIDNSLKNLTKKSLDGGLIVC